MIVMPTTGFSFWSITLKDGTELNEWSSLDWPRDIVEQHKNRDITELRLTCPNGQIASLTITEPCTAFQLKCGGMLQGYGQMRYAHIIGRVDNLETGECTACIWDVFFGLFEHFKTNFHDFKAWRSGIDDVGAISAKAQGIQEVSV